VRNDDYIWDGDEIMLSYFIVFIIGYFSSYIVLNDFFDQSSIVLNTFYRVCWGIFFLFVIWLFRPKSKSFGNLTRKEDK
jgi:hypothetical protein